MSAVTHDLKRGAAEAASLLSSLGAILNDDEELKLTTLEGETTLYEAATKAHERLIELDIMIAGIKQKKAELTERQERFENQIETIKIALLRALESAEVPRLELATATIYTSKGKDAAVITNEAEVPAKYWKKPDPVIDKAAVLRDLKERIDISGATLKNGAPVLNVRNK